MLIKENHQYVEMEFMQLLSNVEIKFASNPEKYKSLITIIYSLVENGQIIEESILSDERISEQIIQINSSYSSNLIDLINDQNTKQFISQQINEWYDYLSSKGGFSDEKKIYS